MLNYRHASRIMAKRSPNRVLNLAQGCFLSQLDDISLFKNCLNILSNCFIFFRKFSSDTTTWLSCWKKFWLNVLKMPSTFSKTTAKSSKMKDTRAKLITSENIMYLRYRVTRQKRSSDFIRLSRPRDVTRHIRLSS